MVQDKDQVAKRCIKDAAHTPDIRKRGERLEGTDDSGDDEVITSQGDNHIATKPPSLDLETKEGTSSKSPKATSIKKRKEKSKKRKKLLSGTSEQVSDDDDICKSFNSKPSILIEGCPSQTVTKSKEQRPIGRHALRGRHIRQKKQALMDDRALNEVLFNPIDSFD